MVVPSRKYYGLPLHVDSRGAICVCFGGGAEVPASDIHQSSGYTVMRSCTLSGGGRLRSQPQILTNQLILKLFAENLIQPFGGNFQLFGVKADTIEQFGGLHSGLSK